MKIHGGGKLRAQPEATEKSFELKIEDILIIDSELFASRQYSGAKISSRLLS